MFGSSSVRVLKQATGVSRISISNMSGIFTGNSNRRAESGSESVRCILSLTTMYTSDIKAMMLTQVNTIALALYKVDFVTGAKGTSYGNKVGLMLAQVGLRKRICKVLEPEHY